MSVHKVAGIVAENGRLELTGLPFPPGARVEVMVVSARDSQDGGDPYPLRGTAVHYDRPFEPVAAEDWEAAS